MATTSSIPPWSIEAWCESQQQQPSTDWSHLHETSASFLRRLNLSSTHPFCDPTTAPNPYAIPGVPGQGPLLSNDHLETFYDVVVTVFAMGAPSLAAMAELWLRLFSSLIAPFGIAHILYTELRLLQQQQQGSSRGSNHKAKANAVKETNYNMAFLSAMCVLTTASSAVLLTDTLYVLEYGPAYGGALLSMAVLLSGKICYSARYYDNMRHTRRAIMGILAVVAILLLRNDPQHQNSRNTLLTFGDSNDAVRIDEGLYYDGTVLRHA